MTYRKEDEEGVLGKMMPDKEKWLAILVCFLFLIICAGAGIYKKEEASSGIVSSQELDGRYLGGVAGRMPANSAKIFFESMLGVRLSGYNGYKSPAEALYALKTGKVAAIWATDTTADFLTGSDASLVLVDNEGTADINFLPECRFEYALAVKNNASGRQLADELDAVIELSTQSGRLKKLIDVYITGACDASKYSEKDMSVNQSYPEGELLKIGITGAAEPIELVDESQRPYGFCVAFADELGTGLQRPVELVVLDNETIFSSLMAGRIDAVFCYGKPKQITTEGTKSWITTKGYYNCEGYRLISVRETAQ